jgi:uncharacterized protein YqgC (DUF456 family)
MDFSSLHIKETVLFLGALIVMVIGVLGVILPILPGLPIVWGAALAYAHLTHYAIIDKTYLIQFGIASGVILILEFFFKTYGVSKMGASKWGAFGAFVGMIVGIVIGNLPALIAGPIIGTILFEMMLGKGLLKSIEAGCGTFIAFFIGTVLQLALALVMIGVFISRVMHH